MCCLTFLTYGGGLLIIPTWQRDASFGRVTIDLVGIAGKLNCPFMTNSIDVGVFVLAFRRNISRSLRLTYKSFGLIKVAQGAIQGAGAQVLVLLEFKIIFTEARKKMNH